LNTISPYVAVIAIITVQLKDEHSVKNAPWVSLLDESAKIVTSRLGKDRLRGLNPAQGTTCSVEISKLRLTQFTNG
jgi:D-amino-acid dehydrogenase